MQTDRAAGDLDAFERMAGERTAFRRSVVIMGGGGIGREITRKLSGSPGISIRVIERDSARAKTIASENSATRFRSGKRLFFSSTSEFWSRDPSMDDGPTTW